MNVICYGDSNTYGYDPRSYFGSRYEKPWPELLHEITGWNVINQGENGKEIPRSTVMFPQHTDLLIVMLGTNDLLQLHGPEEVAVHMSHFLSKLNVPREKILLISPPPMTLGEWVPQQKVIDNSHTLEAGYQTLSQHLGIHFICAGNWNIPLAYDGVHMTPEGHRIFAEQLSSYLRKEKLL